MGFGIVVLLSCIFEVCHTILFQEFRCAHDRIVRDGGFRLAVAREPLCNSPINIRKVKSGGEKSRGETSEDLFDAFLPLLQSTELTDA